MRVSICCEIPFVARLSGVEALRPRRSSNPALEVTYRDVAAEPIAHLTRPADVDPDEDSTRALASGSLPG